MSGTTLRSLPSAKRMLQERTGKSRYLNATLTICATRLGGAVENVDFYVAISVQESRRKPSAVAPYLFIWGRTWIVGALFGYNQNIVFAIATCAWLSLWNHTHISFS